MTITLREFSRAGPCIVLGEFERYTAKSVFYRDRHGVVIRRARAMRFSSLSRIHTEPCRSCRDHPRTLYPEGYMD